MIADNRARNALVAAENAGMALVRRNEKLENALKKALAQLGCHVGRDVNGQIVCCCDFAPHADICSELTVR